MADCCACFGSTKKGKKLNDDVVLKTCEKFQPRGKLQLPSGGDAIQTEIKIELVPEPLPSVGVPAGSQSTVHTFTYKELKDATKNFMPETLIGEGGFGSVYKGQINNTGPLVAVKKLNPTGLQGDKEFLVEVLMLSLLRHSNLVSMFGYCAEGEQRALVYEFMPLGSLEDHLHGITANKEALDWNTRMMIASGAAKGLDYLHNEANPSVIYRDLKSANILLGEKFHPKLSDFGLAKFGPTGDDSHVSTRVMGTDGYCAPEYILTGKLTMKSDVYSFGVVLLELITGCRALDPTRGRGKQNLVEWLRPMLRDRKNYAQLVDPSIKGQFSESVLRRAIEVASMCVREIANARPSMTDVVLALNYLSAHLHDTNADSERGDDGVNKQGMGREIAKGGGDGFVKEIINKDVDRVRAVAEAKLWGESWRQKT